MEEKLQDALNQAAAESVRADQADERATEAEKERDCLQGKLETSKTEMEKLRADSADAEKVGDLERKIKASNTALAAQKKRADDATAPEHIRELVKGRVSLERKAGEVLEGDRFDEMNDRELMEACIARLDKAVEGEKSDEYVIGRFDSLIDAHTAGNAAIERVSEIRQRSEEKNDKRNDTRSAREKFLEGQDGLWASRNPTA